MNKKQTPIPDPVLELSTNSTRNDVNLSECPTQPDTIDESSVPDDISFHDFKLDDRLMKAVKHLHYKLPTKIQASTIPLTLAGSDIIASAQTGTGKTAAFVLPILQKLLSKPSKRPCVRVVVLTPTRELAQQICEVFTSLSKHTNISACAIYGGVKLEPQAEKLYRGCNVVVACPGRLLDHIKRGNTDFRKVDMLVLDEADRMLDMGFLPEITSIVGYIPKKRQTMLFSATFAEELNELAGRITVEPKRIAVDITAPAHTVDHSFYPCPKHLKTAMLIDLLKRTSTNSVLVFTRTKHRANRLVDNLGKAGISSVVMHSNKSQNQRLKALDDFKTGKCSILIATDIASRGLDIDSISHVINYDIPDTVDNYIHRIGRTGRAERSGQALTLISKEDLHDVWEIEKTLGYSVDRVVLNDFDYDSPAPEFNSKPKSPVKPVNKPPKKILRVRKDITSSSAQTAGKRYQKKQPKIIE